MTKVRNGVYPGLAAVLVLEHCLLAARFSLSWFAPEVLLYILVT
jgi:hypothetical protein